MPRLTMLLMSGVLAATLFAACSDNSTSPTSPTPPNPAPGNGGGGTGGGSAAPTTAAVTVGDIFFKSVLNGTSNPAVDTVAVNGTVTWTWATTEALPHSIQSLGSPSFTSSAIITGAGKTYAVTFATPGTYQYDCGVHGQMMTGTIVVVASQASTPASAPPSTTGY
jgi:plastocyanin